MGEVDVSRPERSFVGTVDPFATLPILYFLPESAKTLELPASVSDPDDIEALHEFLRSKIRVSNISKQLPLQANRIVNNAKESLKDATARQPLRETDMNNLSITKCIKHTLAEGKENDYDMQKRRPGFGRKIARFSLKPISHDVVVTSTQPNFDQLKDPEELFAAYERQENAEKELKRLMREKLLDQSSSHCLAGSRTRRRGILGKTATYRHSYTAIAVDVSKHTSAVEKSEAGNNSVPSPRNDDSCSASMSVHGIGMNQGMANNINVLNENGKGTAMGAPLENINLGSLLDAYCNPDEGHTFNLLQKILKMQEIDMHKIQFPNSKDQTWNSKISEETPKNYHAVPETTRSPMTSPTPPKSPLAAISSFCRNKSQKKSLKMREKDTSHSPLMFDLMKESSFATRFEVEAPSHPGSILQQDRSVILRGPASKDVDKSGSSLSGLSQSKWLGTRLNSLTTQADGLAGPGGQAQEKNLIVGSSYKIGSSSISQLPGQEACSINKNSSGFETVSIACPSDQVSGKKSTLENSIMKQSTSGGAIQYPTSEECKVVSSNNCEDVLRDGLTCSAGVELGKDSNGSDKDVNPQISMSSDCMKDKKSDLGNSTEIQSTSGIQHLALEECDAVNNNDYVNMSNDALTCSAGEGLEENSKGFSKDVNPQTGVPSVCIKDSVQATVDPASTAQEVVDGDKGNMLVGSSYKIGSSSISQLPGQEACSINKNSSGFETVSIACPSDQVSGKNSTLENSIMKQSTSGGAIQYPTSEECKVVSSNNCEDVLRDGLTCSAGVELGKDSNGSDKDVNPQIAMSSDCMKDKKSDLGNSTEIQSTSGIQHLALEECDAVNNNDYVNMSNDALTCSAGEGLGENSKGFSKDVNPQTGVPSVCIKDSVQATVDPASTAQEVVDGDKDQTSPPTGACRAQEQHLNETNVSSNPQNETSEAPSKALGWKRSKKMASDHRKSLLGASTAWKSGVRRSTRIRSRPLEYWKGERFLYGRVHNSLVTVIGVKYSSPVDNSKKQTTLKVKSFVSDEYSHLLDLAGSH